MNPEEPNKIEPSTKVVTRRRKSDTTTEAAGVDEESAQKADSPPVPEESTVEATETTEQVPEAEEAAAEPTAVATEEASPVAGGTLDDLLTEDSGLLSEGAFGESAMEDPSLASAEAEAAQLNSEFESLMAASIGIKAIGVGDKIKGRVVSVTKDTVFVDVGMKSEAILDKRETLDDDEKETVAVGDEIEAQVVGLTGEGVRLSLGALKAHQLSEMLATAAQNGIPVEGKVTGFNDGGLEVRVGNRRAFCPKSQIDRGWIEEDLSGYVGQTLQFLVSRFDPTGRKLVVSRRTLMERQSKEMAAETRSKLEVGALMSGTVRKLMPFGAFVDLGGIDGLIHVSELAWRRVDDPAEVLSAGQVVQVKVLKIDDGKDRISLSLRQAGGDPWKDGLAGFDEGKVYEGTVTRLAEFGAFVELAEGLEGLIHVSELDWNRRIKHPKEVLEVGQTVSVMVVEIDGKRRRIGLSVKKAEGGDPFREAVDGVEVGSKIEVVVEKVAEFGVFCTVSEGVTGLIPNSHMNTPRGTNHSRMFKPGTKVDVQVIAVEARSRKITLSRKALEEGGARSDWKAYQKELKRQEKDSGKTALELALEAARAKS
ncbi:MAG: S1 RNA-binding domain-containing protein [Myxococcota bacterium]|nr:S1 RNA-binding domain-containing protein [Myxococcota bacterium]